MSTTRPAPSPTGPPGTGGAGIAGLVRRRPLTAFLVWFFTVGQAFAFAPVLARGAGVELPMQVFVIGSTLFGLLLPAVVITGLVDGSAGVRALLRSSVAVRVPVRWYALALVGVPLLAVALAFALVGMPPSGLTAASVASALVVGLLLQTVVALVPNNWAEEVAWMGFFQARLEQRTGTMRAAALTAPLFALQHTALVVGQPVLFGVGLLVFLAVLSVPGRALMAWTYHRSGSLFVVGLLHAAGNAAAGSSGFALGFLPRLYPGSGTVGVMHLLAFALVGTALIIGTRARLGGTSGGRGRRTASASTPQP